MFNLSPNMLLRIGLGSLFGVLAFLILREQEATEYYIHFRYDSIRYLLDNIAPSLSPPEDLFTGLSFSFFIFWSLFFIVGSLLILLNMKRPLLVYSVLVLIIGILLHAPYDDRMIISQTRRLLATIAIFFCILGLALNKSK